ncbi:hypothetical protein [Corynebacterium diphtheriae]|uniref:hypothetical protein n=1 Tax=Corynebacterium diphtheriae TaxID=1717 RepID=UPI00064CB561|nr:hypothetical protein [Corynebacterium diphtheriae]OWN06729.1 hypothetical protein AY479_06575 [Corynebacterium belfantii]KLN42305.1 hypothetical protein AL07_02155 [Corynebacterium diphtheriae bv. gravis str. ISS 4060]MBG9264580.1 hypothetical protein [Corynebacterium diphtheriae bv. gravis]OWM48337.1 hypothetical protein BU161_06880 [Corynebacterium diphtheriae]OWM52609.1 hypothetical protein BU169_07340 [Corynebacterium diphtheriae]
MKKFIALTVMLAFGITPQAWADPATLDDVTVVNTWADRTGDQHPLAVIRGGVVTLSDKNSIIQETDTELIEHTSAEFVVVVPDAAKTKDQHWSLPEAGEPEDLVRDNMTRLVFETAEENAHARLGKMSGPGTMKFDKPVDMAAPGSYAQGVEFEKPGLYVAEIILNNHSTVWKFYVGDAPVRPDYAGIKRGLADVQQSLRELTKEIEQASTPPSVVETEEPEAAEPAPVIPQEKPQSHSKPQQKPQPKPSQKPKEKKVKEKKEPKEDKKPERKPAPKSERESTTHVKKAEEQDVRTAAEAIRKRGWWSGFLLGLGAMAMVGGIVFFSQAKNMKKQQGKI